MDHTAHDHTAIAISRVTRGHQYFPQTVSNIAELAGCPEAGGVWAHSYTLWRKRIAT